VAATPSGSLGSWVGTGGTQAGTDPALAAALELVVAAALLVPVAAAAALDVVLAAAALVLLEFDELLPQAAIAMAASSDSPRAQTARPATTRIEIPSPSLRTARPRTPVHPWLEVRDWRDGTSFPRPLSSKIVRRLSGSYVAKRTNVVARSGETVRQSG